VDLKTHASADVDSIIVIMSTMENHFAGNINWDRNFRTRRDVEKIAD
jgi:hypothetical protein